MPNLSDYLAAQPDVLKNINEGSTYVNGIYDQAAKLKAGQAFAQGDYGTAATTLAGRGDLADAEAVKNYGTSQFQAQHEYIQRAIPVFQHIYQTAAGSNGDTAAGTVAVTKAFDTISPDLKTLGVPDEKIQAYRSALASDPQGTLQALNAVAARKFTYQKVGENGLGVFDDNTGEMVGYHQGNQFITAGPGQKVVQVGADGATPAGAPGGAPAAPQQPQAAPTPVPPPASQPVPASGAGPQPATAAPGFAAFYNNFLAPHEGGFTPSDGNGKPANFGINQGANPDVDVSKLTQDQAMQLAHDRYWAPSGADKLPPALAAIQADTAFNMGVGTANQLLQQSGGDPQKYLDLRAQRYQQIAANDPSKAQNLPGWLQRNSDLGHYVAGIGAAQPGNAPPAPVQPGPSATGGARVVFDGGPEFRAPTPDELKQFPGANQINAATGEVKYPPTSALGASMTDEQVQPYVDILRAGGIIPQSLARNPALYTRVLNVAKAQGVAPEDFLTNQANRKATQTAFQDINTRYTLVQTQEQTFQNSLNFALQKVKALGQQGGGTFINNWKNYLATGVKGDPATGAAIDAVSTAMNEYGKIIEGSTGNAGSSISARDDANKMLSAADNIPAFLSKMQVLQQDAQYKIGSLKDQHDTLLTALAGIGQAAPAATAPKIIDFSKLPK